MFNKKIFALRIKELRKQNEMQAKDVAEKIGITKQAMSLLEKGINTPSVETLNAIADLFNVPTDYLLGRTDSPTPPE